MREDIDTSVSESRELFDARHSKANPKMTKIPKCAIAPGKKGKFQNWGEDLYLLPDLFPFGQGVYLNCISENNTKNSGFAI